MSDAERRREQRLVGYRLRRALRKAAYHKNMAESGEARALNHWTWTNHYTREATELARELARLQEEAKDPRAGDVR